MIGLFFFAQCALATQNLPEMEDTPLGGLKPRKIPEHKYGFLYNEHTETGSDILDINAKEVFAMIERDAPEFASSATV